MSVRCWLCWVLALGLLAAITQIAGAQAPIKGRFSPLSNVGGHTSQELSTIYNEAIGSGYSVSSLNSIALSNAYARSGYSGQPTASRPRLTTQAAPAPAAKPFAGFSPSPTTSPYLNLFREDFAGNSDLNYNTLVRPQLQQQAFNQQVQRQNQEMSRRVQAMAAQSDFNPQGDRQQFPTGHQTVFNFHSHYHPTAAYRPQR